MFWLPRAGIACIITVSQTNCERETVAEGSFHRDFLLFWMRSGEQF